MSHLPAFVIIDIFELFAKIVTLFELLNRCDYVLYAVRDFYRIEYSASVTKEAL